MNEYSFSEERVKGLFTDVLIPDTLQPDAVVRRLREMPPKTKSVAHVILLRRITAAAAVIVVVFTVFLWNQMSKRQGFQDSAVSGGTNSAAGDTAPAQIFPQASSGDSAQESEEALPGDSVSVSPAEVPTSIKDDEPKALGWILAAGSGLVLAAAAGILYRNRRRKKSR